MLRNILFVSLVLASFSSSAQVVVGLVDWTANKKNSARTQLQIDESRTNIENAYLAYNERNLEKSKYYIDQSQRDGFKSGDFYFLLGVYMYHTNEMKAAKRYWKIAHKEGGCWECKELLEKLAANEPLSEIIDQKVVGYINSLER